MTVTIELEPYEIEKARYFRQVDSIFGKLAAACEGSDLAIPVRQEFSDAWGELRNFLQLCEWNQDSDERDVCDLIERIDAALEARSPGSDTPSDVVKEIALRLNSLILMSSEKGYQQAKSDAGAAVYPEDYITDDEINTAERNILTLVKRAFAIEASGLSRERLTALIAEAHRAVAFLRRVEPLDRASELEYGDQAEALQRAAEAVEKVLAGDIEQKEQP